MDGAALIGPWAERLGIALDDTQFKKLAAYLAALAKHNAKTNLTADTDERLWWTRHIADGLAVVPMLKRLAGAAPRVLDLGSGGGFIGMAVKIAWPEADVTLMDTSYRKFQFLNLAAAELGTPGLHVLWRRAGQPLAAEPFDAVVARALAELSSAKKLALSLTRDGGRAILYQTQAPPPGAGAREFVAYRLPEEAADRHLAVFAKGGTP